MGRKIKKTEKSDLRIRKQRIIQLGDQLAFEFLGPICAGKKKGRPTNGSPIKGESKDSGKEASEAVDPAQLSLPF